MNQQDPQPTDKPKVTLPPFLAKYQQSPEQILGKRLLPPATPKNTPPRSRISPIISPDEALNLATLFEPVPLGPTKYRSASQLQKAIELYFERANARIGTPEYEEPTIPDLALALGFSTRQELLKYRDNGDDYSHVINSAITKFEAKCNRQLMRGGPATQGNIFLAKNLHGYADKTEQTTTHTVGGTLEAMVQAMQGRVLRPMMPAPNQQSHTPEPIDAEFTTHSPNDDLC
jgi:hypothetical protein